MDPEIFKVTLGQPPAADQPQNLKEKYFGSLDEGETRAYICQVQPHPSVSTEDDHSNTVIKTLHENSDTYFWAPLIDNSDDNCAERIALTEIKSRTVRETIPKNSPEKASSFKKENTKHFYSTWLEGNVFFRKKRLTAVVKAAWEKAHAR